MFLLIEALVSFVFTALDSKTPLLLVLKVMRNKSTRTIGNTFGEICLVLIGQRRRWRNSEWSQHGATFFLTINFVGETANCKVLRPIKLISHELQSLASRKVVVKQVSWKWRDQPQLEPVGRYGEDIWSTCGWCLTLNLNDLLSRSSCALKQFQPPVNRPIFGVSSEAPLGPMSKITRPYLQSCARPVRAKCEGRCQRARHCFHLVAGYHFESRLLLCYRSLMEVVDRQE